MVCYGVGWNINTYFKDKTKTLKKYWWEYLWPNLSELSCALGIAILPFLNCYTSEKSAAAPSKEKALRLGFSNDDGVH